MEGPVQTQVREATAMLAGVLFHVREALGGREEFNAEIVQALALPLKAMAPIVARAAELRAGDSELAGDLKEYSDTLTALQGTLDQVRFMLLARQTCLQASRNHLETLNLWATTLNQTR